MAKKAQLSDLGSYENVLATFRRYDINKDNLLSWKEFHRLMVDLNEQTSGYRWKESNTDLLLAQLDKDKNGGIDMNELINHIFPRADAMGGVAGASEYEMVLEAFRRHDTNRNGTLDVREFHRLMTQIRPGWTQANTDRVFGAVDKDRSGEVESDELIAWLFGVPADRKNAARKGRNAMRRGRDPPPNAGPLVVIEFTCGAGNAEINVDRIGQTLLKKLEGVSYKKTVQGSSNTISKVTARDGAIVFWDAATMMAYRDNPFMDMKTTEAWLKDMVNRQIPRLLSGT